MPSPRRKYASVVALVTDKRDPVDHLLYKAATHLQARDLKIAGTVQKAYSRQEGCCDDFSLRNLAGLIAEIDNAISCATNALILNRFGYSESQGGGFRPLIEHAVELEIPVLLAVNRSYYDAWHEYAGAFSSDLPATVQNVKQWCLAVEQISDLMSVES